MIQGQESTTKRGPLPGIAAIINIIILKAGFTVSPLWYYLLPISIPLLILIGIAGGRSPDRK
jgi:hypothetical protein